MENEEASSPARPSIGFPVGFALLVVSLLCTCGFLLCCLYWNRIRSLFRGFQDDGNAADNQMDTDRLHQKLSPDLHMKSKENQPQSVLVSMPGDRVPKFVAMKCPCKPAILEKFIVIEQKAPN